MPAETEFAHDIRAQARSRQIAELAERQHGFVATWQLDLGRGAIAHAVAAGRLHRWYRGVYAVGHRAVRREGRWMAAVLAVGPGAVLSHRAAAALWAIRPSVRPRIEVTTARKAASRDDIQIHCARLAPDEVTVHDGIPVTTAARTLVDLAAVVSAHELDRAVNQAEILRLPYPDLTRYKGRRGVTGLRREPTNTRNDFEAAFAAFVEAHDLPAPLVNRPLDATEPDFRWPAHKLIVELDGFATHGTRRAFERDRERDRRLQTAGWRVVRITWRQLHEDRTELAADLHALLPRLSAKQMISTNQFKNGNHIEVDGTVFKILEFQHVKPGKGGAFVRTKLRRASDGAVIDRTFRAGEKFRPVHTEARKMQFLYADGSDAHFMDEQTFEQIAIPEPSVEEPLKWIKPNESVDLLYIDGDPADVQLSASVELEVTHTEPGVRGDTASGGGNKPATLETGATIQVPLFVNIGDRVKVDTRSGSYMSRA